MVFKRTWVKQIKTLGSLIAFRRNLAEFRLNRIRRTATMTKAFFLKFKFKIWSKRIRTREIFTEGAGLRKVILSFQERDNLRYRDGLNLGAM
jgi:hypothetical protein